MSETSRSNNVLVLNRATAILEALGSDPRGMRISEVARVTGMPMTTVHRILHSLALSELAVQNPSSNRWELGLKVFALGQRVHTRARLCELSYTEMQALFSGTQLRSLLSVPNGDSMLVLKEILPPDCPLTVNRVGESAPMHLVASGKLFLSTMSPGELRSYAERSRLTETGIEGVSAIDELLMRISRIREFGWSLDREEWKKGLLTAAAPIYQKGIMVAAIAIESMLPDEIPHMHIERLVQSAKRISAALG